MQVHNRHDDNLVRKFTKEDAERKRLGQATTDIHFDDGIKPGIDANAVNGVLHRCQKATTKVPLLGLVRNTLRPRSSRIPHPEEI